MSQLDNQESFFSPVKNMNSAAINAERKSDVRTTGRQVVNATQPRKPYANRFRMRTVDNNIRGKTIDKITAEHMKPAPNAMVSIYGQDFTHGNFRNSTGSLDPHYQTIDGNKLRAVGSSVSGPRSNGEMLSQSAVTTQSQVLIPTHLQQASYHAANSPQQTATEHVAESVRFAPSEQRVHTQPNEDNRSVTMKSCAFDSSHPMHGELNTIIDENTEYFNHVVGLCICGKCSCGKHKCKHGQLKLKQKGPGLSVYQKDFPRHPVGAGGPVLKNDFFTTFHNNETMSLATTMRTDYKPWGLGAPQRFGDPTKFHSVPFAGKSSYRSEFVNWGPNPVSLEKNNQGLSVISELPFLSKTTYGDNFGNWHPSKTESTKKKNERSPLSPGIPFLGETSSMKDYKPFKVGPNGYKKPGNDWEPTDSYPDQYKPTYTKDFASPTNRKCPAIEIINTYKSQLIQKN